MPKCGIKYMNNALSYYANCFADAVKVLFLHLRTATGGGYFSPFASNAFLSKYYSVSGEQCFVGRFGVYRGSTLSRQSLDSHSTLKQIE